MKTAAELFRQKVVVRAKAKADLNGAAESPHSTFSEPLELESQQASAAGDLDEEIRKLEAELAQVDNDDDDDDSSEDESTDGGSSEIGTNDHSNNDAATPAIVNLSQLQRERIESLPSSALPALNKRAASSNISDPNPSKRKRAPNGSAPAAGAPKGLESAVQDFLRGYQARSAERLPFYCRVCAQQYTNETEFVHHQTRPQHQTAVALDRKASFCKLCRKQLTSPAQLKEHLQSRPHKERLEFMKTKQQRSGATTSSTRPNERTATNSRPPTNARGRANQHRR